MNTTPKRPCRIQRVRFELTGTPFRVSIVSDMLPAHRGGSRKYFYLYVYLYQFPRADIHVNFNFDVN